MSMPIPVPKNERAEVVLIAFMDQIAIALLKRNKPKTARHNRLLALRQSVDRVDKTYHGHLPDHLQSAAEQLLEILEEKIVKLDSIEDVATGLCSEKLES